MAPTNRARNARAIEADFDRALATLVETATRSIRVQRASVWFVEDGDSAWRQHDVYDAANDKHASGITMRADDYPELAAALAYINQTDVFMALAQLRRDGQKRRNMAARPAAA